MYSVQHYIFKKIIRYNHISPKTKDREKQLGKNFLKGIKVPKTFLSRHESSSRIHRSCTGVKAGFNSRTGSMNSATGIQHSCVKSIFLLHRVVHEQGIFLSWMSSSTRLLAATPSPSTTRFRSRNLSSPMRIRNLTWCMLSLFPIAFQLNATVTMSEIITKKKLWMLTEWKGEKKKKRRRKVVKGKKGRDWKR